MKKLTISILGCGWLGLPLLKALVDDGHTARGSSRNPETLAAITAAGGEAFLIDLPQALPAGFTYACDVLIITIPPRGRQLGAAAKSHYDACFASLSDWLSAADGPSIIYTSSIGVYGNHRPDGVTTERNRPAPWGHSAVAALHAEFLLECYRHPLAILRLAGLVGPGRHPGHFFGGKDRLIPQADTPVNLVHQNDVIAAVKLCLTNKENLPVIYNVCAAVHPDKGIYYTAAAQSLGLAVKGIETKGFAGKTINSDKLRALGWLPEWDDLSLDYLIGER